MRRVLDPRVGQLNRVRVLEIRYAEQLIRLRDANDAVPPEDAVHDVPLEAFLAHGDVRLDDLGVDGVAENGAVLDKAD